MRIEAHPSTGRPEPQFVVYAESQQDGLILKMFLSAENDKKTIFWKHGTCYSSNVSGYTSFNFGYRKMNSAEIIGKRIATFLMKFKMFR